MKKINIILILLLLTSFTSFGQTKVSQSLPITKNNPMSTIKIQHNLQNYSTKHYNNWEILSKENYTIKHPPEWEVNTSGKMGTSFILFSPLVSKSEKFRTNINLIIQDLEGITIDSRTINLKEYTERSIVEIKNKNTKSGGKIISSDLINVNGISHQKVIYTGVSKEGLRLQYEQYYWVEKNKAYVLTLTCQEYKFIDYQAIGEKIFDSFIIK
jgi:hypothetical protein